MTKKEKNMIAGKRGGIRKLRIKVKETKKKRREEKRTRKQK